MDFDFQEFPPSEELEKVIKSFFVVDYDSKEVRKDYLLPNGTPSFFLVKTQTVVNMNMPEVHRSFEVNEGIYIGYMSNLVELAHGAVQVVGLFMNPIYLYLLFDITPKELLNRFIEVQPLPELEELRKWMDKPRLSIEEVTEGMERFIHLRLANHQARNDLQDVIDELTGQMGYRLSVEEIADKMGFTRRYLSELFNKHFGMSPKQYIKLTRFNQALKLMAEKKPGDTYATIAHQLGYHDQAHFIRDFKNICGKTPSDLKAPLDSLAYRFRYFK